MQIRAFHCQEMGSYLTDSWGQQHLCFLGVVQKAVRQEQRSSSGELGKSNSNTKYAFKRLRNLSCASALGEDLRSSLKFLCRGKLSDPWMPWPIPGFWVLLESEGSPPSGSYILAAPQGGIWGPRHCTVNISCRQHWCLCWLSLGCYSWLLWVESIVGASPLCTDETAVSGPGFFMWFAKEVRLI